MHLSDILTSDLDPREVLKEKSLSAESAPMKTTGRRKALLIGINYVKYDKDGFVLKLPYKKYDRLYGSHVDIESMKEFLESDQGWTEESITVMTDEYPDIPSHLIPTRENIITQMHSLAENAKPGDHLFLQFSGHGDQIPDEDYDEADGMDEIIISSDALIITDDEMHEVLVRKLPSGCKMSVVFDCCSSGTALDLPVFPDKSVFLDSPVEGPDSLDVLTTSPENMWSPNGIQRAARHFYHSFTEEPESILPGLATPTLSSTTSKSSTSISTFSSASRVPTYDTVPQAPYVSQVPLPSVSHSTLPHLHANTSPSPSASLDSVTALPYIPFVPHKNTMNPYVPHNLANIRTTGYRPAVRKKFSSGEVVMWSSCRDGEVSGEVEKAGVSRGAMTHAFIESMKSDEYKARPTYHNLLNCIRTRIHSYKLIEKQHVQLSSSLELNPENAYDF